MDNWLLPITLLPAVGLIIMSTTNLSNALSGEINQLIHNEGMKLEEVIQRKLVQLRLLSLSLFGEYLSAACFCVAGLISGIFMTEGGGAPKASYWLISIGVFMILVALILLAIFAFRAVGIKQKQFELMEE